MDTLLNRRELIKLGAAFVVAGKGFKMNDTNIPHTDVLIIGGGPAGLSAALCLGRANRTALVIDDGRPRNAPAGHMHNFPSQDGLPPLEFRNKIKEDIKSYEKISVRSGHVEDVVKLEDGFIATIDSKKIKARRVILAYGVTDLFPEISGMKELWGKSIFHCPYCHGYEIRNTPIGLIGDQNYFHHMVPLIANLSKDLVLFTNGIPWEGERYKTIKIVESKIKNLLYDGEDLKGIELEDGSQIPRKYLYLRPPQKPKSQIGEKLGCKLNEHNLHVIEESGKTNIEGVFAVGDLALMRQSVLTACSQGMVAATQINFELCKEEAPE